MTAAQSGRAISELCCAALTSYRETDTARPANTETRQPGVVEAERLSPDLQDSLQPTFLRLAPLAALGVASIAIDVIAFLWPFPLDSWWQYARLDYAWLTQYELNGQIRFVGAFGLLFALYQWAFLHLRAR